MSRLEQLIAELCPDGVEYVKLTSVCNVLYGYPFDSKLFTEDSTFMQLIRIRDVKPGESRTFYRGDILPEYVINKGDILVGMDGEFNLEKWKSDDALLNQRVCKISAISEELVLNGYIYHLLAPIFKQMELQIAGSTVKHLSAKAINSLSIPLPPLPIQQEIVRILDNFTELTAELTAEQTARKKQYEYYRDLLLTFGDDAETTDGRRGTAVEWVTLGEVCSLSAGGDVPRTSYSKEETDKYIVPIYSNGIGENALYGYTDKAKITVPCITIAARGTIGYCELRNEPFYPIVRLICAIPNERLTAAYLCYIVQTLKFILPTSGIPQLTIPMISSYKIPLPPLAEQARIVAILDRFDALCNDITSGLPAEIEARRKQYEYYRDRLLTFREKVTA